MKTLNFILILFCTFNFSCSQTNYRGPGYRWELFKETPHWKLAQALSVEDSSEIIKLLGLRKADINYQESQFGNTLLFLAVANDKRVSTELLLNAGADVNIRDKSNQQVIHEVSKFPIRRKNALAILKLLLEYGADVNAIQIDEKNDNYKFVPLQGSVEDFNFAKVLIDNGADLYFKVGDYYPIWFTMLLDDRNDGILLARYLILDKKEMIPNPIFYSIPDSHPRDIYFMLNSLNFEGNAEKNKARADIISYLKTIKFPSSRKQLFVDKE